MKIVDKNASVTGTLESSRNSLVGMTTGGPAFQFATRVSAHFEEAQSVLPVVTEKYVFQATLTVSVSFVRRMLPVPPKRPNRGKFTIICVRYVIVLAVLDTPRDQELPRNDTSARAPMSMTVTVTALQGILVRHHGLVAPPRGTDSSQLARIPCSRIGVDLAAPGKSLGSKWTRRVLSREAE